MLEAMNHMMQTMKVEILCDKRPGPPQLAERKAITDSGHNAPSPIQNEHVGEQGKRSLQNVIESGPEAEEERVLNAHPTWMESTRLHPDESCLAPRYGCVLPRTGVAPAMMGSTPAAEKIAAFCDEDTRGKTLREFIKDVWIKKDNYGWSDEQVARLLNEVCHGRAGAALDLMPTDARTNLSLVMKALEREFYSEAKQTASSLAFNSRVRRHGETEREYAHALRLLAIYAYKDATPAHVESRCREQFLAGLRCRDVKAHLSWFCRKEAKVHELVSSAEAFRAMREENTLVSDTEGSAVTVAYVQGGRPGNTYAQSQRSALGSSTEKAAENKKDGRRRKFRNRGNTNPDKCKGKCCFKCGKEGHFIADCKSVAEKCLYTVYANDLRCHDATNLGGCQCACGKHVHFLSKEDAQLAAVILARSLETPVA